MSNVPLMPMATAVWLVENTTLTFKQIATFCNLHEIEVQGIADGEVAKGGDKGFVQQAGFCGRRGLSLGLRRVDLQKGWRTPRDLH